LILLELTAEQCDAVEAPFDECFAIVGAPGTGKSTALAERAARLRRTECTVESLMLHAPGGIEKCAVGLLADAGKAPTLVDDVEAELLFADACMPLFALEWEEFIEGQLDPEVAALNWPQRFLQSAFRLIRRLCDGGVEPTLFLSCALTGATEFYAQPPNFADPRLIAETKTNHQNSLAATAQELSRQRRREIDLSKILAKLYERYLDVTRSSARMTGRDAVIAATELLREDSAFAQSQRRRYPFAFIDDAQELTAAELRFLTGLYGERLRGVTLCGDPSSAISETRLTTPEAVFALAHSKTELHGTHRTPKVEKTRFPTAREEAEAIAQRVASWLERGSPPERVAVLFRSVRAVETYERALLERNIPAVVAGDVNVFADRRALDALALLWNVDDPFRHDWLLRTLSGRALALSDASVAFLCGDPPDPQRQLFAFDEEPPPTARAGRWNPKRDLRLGWNVVRGELDDALPPAAATRLQRFRRLREGWLSIADPASFGTFARTVWREGLAREGDIGSAAARAQQILLRRLLDRLDGFLRRNEGADLSDVLRYAEQRIESELETCEVDDSCGGCVQLLSIEAARGREFDRVAIANVRAGAFPRYYSPEAFLFSKRYGMIPKDNAGDARASRTAKFTYYTFRYKTRQHYFERERRALEYGLRRARADVLVTASGRPSRSGETPEFLDMLG